MKTTVIWERKRIRVTPAAAEAAANIRTRLAGEWYERLGDRIFEFFDKRFEELDMAFDRAVKETSGWKRTLFGFAIFALAFKAYGRAGTEPVFFGAVAAAGLLHRWWADWRKAHPVPVERRHTREYRLVALLQATALGMIHVGFLAAVSYSLRPMNLPAIGMVAAGVGLGIFRERTGPEEGEERRQHLYVTTGVVLCLLAMGALFWMS